MTTIDIDDDIMVCDSCEMMQFIDSKKTIAAKFTVVTPRREIWADDRHLLKILGSECFYYYLCH